MSNALSVGIPFFPSVKFYQRGDFCYFVNTEIGTWVALPNYFVKVFFDKQHTETPSEQYLRTGVHKG